MKRTWPRIANVVALLLLTKSCDVGAQDSLIIETKSVHWQPTITVKVSITNGSNDVGFIGLPLRVMGNAKLNTATQSGALTAHGFVMNIEGLPGESGYIQSASGCLPAGSVAMTVWDLVLAIDSASGCNQSIYIDTALSPPLGVYSIENCNSGSVPLAFAAGEVHVSDLGPVCTFIPTYDVRYDHGYICNCMLGYDPDDYWLTRELINGSPGYISPDGVYSWYNMTPQDVGRRTIWFRATDPCGLWIECSFFVNVLPIPLELICADLIAARGEQTSRDVRPTNGIQPFTFSLLEGPGELSPSGEWQYTPSCSDPSVAVVRIHVVDSIGGEGYCQFSVTLTPSSDADADGIESICDNCPYVFNPVQEDIDLDGSGDLCDDDDDNDGVPDDIDNSPKDYNSGQEDNDGDGIGDVSDPDDDNDGIIDDGDGTGLAGDNPCISGQTTGCDDNCQGSMNPDQVDIDGDGIGDVCEGDSDGDGVADSADNCYDRFNPSQSDYDGDSVGDVCDTDDDGDGIADIVDNCPWMTNPMQEDGDGDGTGDSCDTCPCICINDPVCDNVRSDVLDVVLTINVAFRAHVPILDPSPICPYETTDFTCSGTTDVVDVVLVVNVAFRGASTDAEYCSPCP